MRLRRPLPGFLNASEMALCARPRGSETLKKLELEKEKQKIDRKVMQSAQGLLSEKIEDLGPVYGFKH